MFTVTQTAKVASKIIPKTTQEGIIPPRRRTSVRVPMISMEICCTEARELVRGVTRCDLIRSSIQYVFATLLTSITSQLLCRSDFAQVLLSSSMPTAAKVKAPQQQRAIPCPE
jgi:hypothetical protein